MSRDGMFIAIPVSVLALVGFCVRDTPPLRVVDAYAESWGGAVGAVRELDRELETVAGRFQRFDPAVALSGAADRSVEQVMVQIQFPPEFQVRPDLEFWLAEGANTYTLRLRDPISPGQIVNGPENLGFTVSAPGAGYLIRYHVTARDRAPVDGSVAVRVRHSGR